MRHNEFIKCPCILIQTQVNQNFVSCCSFANSCLNLHDSVDCSTAGFPVLPYLSEFAQTHVHWVDDAIQPSYPLLPPSPPVLSLSQCQGLFQWVSSSHQVAKHWNFSFSIILPKNIQSRFALELTALISCYVRNSPDSSQHHSSKTINSLVFSLPYGPTLTSILEKP